MSGKNHGVQCRTMLSQRPCRNPECTREECARNTLYSKVFASVLMDGTKDGTENGSTVSVSVPQSEGVSESAYALESLTDDDVSLLIEALYALNNHAERGDTYNRCMDMIDRLYRVYDN